MVAFLFAEVSLDEKAVKAVEGEHDYLAAVLRALEPLEDWSHDRIEETLRRLASERDLKPRKAFQPIRAAVTGTLVSPPLFESLELLGKERTIERLRAAD
jgi:glutamyl-tRNA synthetase